MSVQPPASLKPVLGYLKKGDELDSDQSNPDSIIVAFACRQFAIVSFSMLMYILFRYIIFVSATDVFLFIIYGLISF